jgi:ubiquinone/menaquinone biosynthesis C-methylase UbiE
VKVVSPAAFFEAIARRYDRVYALDATVTRARMKRVLAHLPPAPARVVDLGVGTGRELGSLQDAGYEVTGLDVSPAMLALCARRARPITLVEADLWTTLPFSDASVDAVIALHGTLAHPPERGAYGALATECARITRPGGAFVAEVPSQAWLKELRGETVGTAGARLARIAEDRLLHQDDATGLAVEAVVPSDDEWRATFAPAFDVTCEVLGEAETLVVGRRR